MGDQTLPNDVRTFKPWTAPLPDEESVILGKLLNATIEQTFVMRLKWLEALAAAYVAYTGVRPEDAELVEERRETKTVWYFRRKANADDLSALSEIIAQLESCGFECVAGPIENNVEFKRLKAISSRSR